MIIYMSQTINLIAVEQGVPEAQKIVNESTAYPLRNGEDVFFVVKEKEN